MVKVKVHFEELLSSLNSNWLHLFEGPLIYAHWPHNAAAHAFAKLVPTVVSTRSNAVSHYSHCLFNVKNWKVLVIGRFCRCRMGLTTMHSWCSPMARVWQRQLAQFSIWKHPLGGPNTTTVTFLRGNQRCAFDWISNKDVLLWLLFQTKASKYRVKYEKYCSQLFFWPWEILQYWFGDSFSYIVQQNFLLKWLTFEHIITNDPDVFSSEFIKLFIWQYF